jgi:hypothetical protein
MMTDNLFFLSQDATSKVGGKGLFKEFTQPMGQGKFDHHIETDQDNQVQDGFDFMPKAGWRLQQIDLERLERPVVKFQRQSDAGKG